MEKRENAKLYLKIEEKYAQIKDLEAKLSMTQTELSKKSQKISQVTGSMFLYQNQLEKLRKELEDERNSFVTEISHLNAIIAEKNSVIEKLKSEGTFEKEQETFQTGLTLDTMVFDSILDFDEKTNEAQTPRNTDLNFSEFPARREFAFGAEEFAGNLGGFIRTKINSRNFRSRDFVMCQTEDKDTQTQTLMTAQSPAVSVSPIRKMVSQFSQANLEVAQTFVSAVTSDPQSTKECNQTKLFEVRLEDMAKQVSVLRAELENSMEENSKLVKDLQIKENELQQMTNKLLKVSEESTVAFDLINDEYEKAIKLIKQLKKQH